MTAELLKHGISTTVPPAVHKALLGSAVNLRIGLSVWIWVCGFAMLSFEADRANQHHHRALGYFSTPQLDEE
jgi:hypothetical protein